MAGLTRIDVTEMRARVASGAAPPIVLAGAGVSMLAPSSLPSGDELRDLCVTALLREDRSEAALAQLLQTPAYRSLVPEAVLQIVGSTMGEALDRQMQRLLGAVSPNTAHRALAQKDWRVYTTNFDLCFERAGCRSVTHLHGTIAAKASLQNRLYRIGKGVETEMSDFGRALQSHPLLVVGYSLRDEDVLKIIRSHLPPHIYYLSYSGDIPIQLRELGCQVSVATGSIEELLDLRPRGAVPRRIPEVRPPQTPTSSRVLVLVRLCSRAGLYELDRDLLHLYEGRMRGRSRLLAMCSVADSHRMARRYSEAWGLTGRVLRSRAALRSEWADAVSTAHVLRGLVLLQDESKKFSEAEAYFTDGLLIFEHLVASEPPGKYAAENDIWRARIFNNMGWAAQELGEHSKALALFRRSMALKRRHHERYGVTQTWAHIACGQIGQQRWNAANASIGRVLRGLTSNPDTSVAYSAADLVFRKLRQAGILPESDWQAFIRDKRAAIDWHGLEATLSRASTASRRMREDLSSIWILAQA